MLKIAVTLPKLYNYDNDFENIISESRAQGGPEAELHFYDEKSVSKQQLLDADAIIGNPPLGIIESLPRLKWLQLHSAGADSYAKLSVFSGKNAPVLCNSTGAYGKTLSEHMITQMLTLTRDFHIYRDNMHEHCWNRIKVPDTIADKKVLLMGLGDIGINLAKKLDCFGAEVYGIRRTGRPAPFVKEVHPLSDLESLLPEMDFVALCLPNSDETTHVINADTLKLMKPSAFVVNVGRGPSVDNLALAEALKNGIIAGAALDVTEPEPLPPDHPLWNCKNCLITPHSAGWYDQRSPYEGILKIACENLENFLMGRELTHKVDIKTGYAVPR